MFLCTNYVLVSSLFTSREINKKPLKINSDTQYWKSIYVFLSNVQQYSAMDYIEHPQEVLLSLKHIKDITMVLHFHLLNGILMLAVGTVGICGNCFCIVYFGQACTRRNKGQTYFLFMFCLAIFDLVAIICCILCFALPHYSYEVCRKSNYCRDMNPKNNR